MNILDLMKNYSSAMNASSWYSQPANYYNLWNRNYLTNYYGGASTTQMPAPRFDVSNYNTTIQNPAPTGGAGGQLVPTPSYTYNPTVNITPPVSIPPPSQQQQPTQPTQNQQQAPSDRPWYWDQRTGQWHQGESAYAGQPGHTGTGQSGGVNPPDFGNNIPTTRPGPLTFDA